MSGHDDSHQLDSFGAFVSHKLGYRTLEEMPFDTFLRALEREGLTGEQAILRMFDRIIPEARDHWPDTDLIWAAQDHPVALMPTSQEDGQSRERRVRRASSIIKRLDSNPAVQAKIRAESNRLRKLYAAEVKFAREESSIHVEPETYARWRVTVEADTFSRSHRFDGVSERDLTDCLYKLATPDDTPEALRGTVPVWWFQRSRPSAYVNIARRPVSVQMPPGAIMIDVTSATENDVKLLWDAIREAQQRLRSVTPRGGRPRNDAIPKRIEGLQESGHTWKEIPDIINNEFTDKTRTLKSLKRQQTRWREKRRA